MINLTTVGIEAGDVLVAIKALNDLRDQLMKIVVALNTTDFEALMSNVLTRNKIASIIASIRVLNSNANDILANTFDLSGIQGTSGVLTVGSDGKIVVKSIAASNIVFPPNATGLLTATSGILTTSKLTLPGVAGVTSPVSTSGAGLAYTSMSVTLIAALQPYMHTAPPGLIVAYSSTTIPGGWLVCDGSSIPPAHTELIEQYPSGKLPDLRGFVLRMYDPTATVDTDANSRVNYDGSPAGNVVGSVQYDAFPTHTHQATISGTYNNAELTTITTAIAPPTVTSVNVNVGAIASLTSGDVVDMAHNTSGSATHVSESEPKDILVTWIIKT